MNFRTDSYPSIQICSLGAAREIDHSTYDGVITIEDSLVDDPLRIDESDCPQLVLCFDDIASPKDEWIMPKERHVRSALEFADELGGGSLLIHCHAGISRSSGIALAIIAKGLGPGKEKQAFIELENGKTPKEIKSNLIKLYGEGILFMPENKISILILYGFPLLLIGIGIFFLFNFSKK